MEQPNKFKDFHRHFVKKDKYKIIIWGAGDTAREALKYKSDIVEVMGFLDNNSNIKEFEGLQALEKDSICQYDYDYIVICSRSYEEIYKQLLRMGGDVEKILVNPIPKAQTYSSYQDNVFERKWNVLTKRNRMEIFISGISYHSDGIDEVIFKEKTGKETFNLANSGQDIFYDYQIAKLLNCEKLLQDTTHYIIGLCYYSFDYDLSKTENGWEIIRYYPYIKEQHNLMPAASFETFVPKAKEYMGKCEIYYRLFDKRCAYVVDNEQAEKTARGDFKKYHPITVWENKEILKQFLSFLREQEIKPIVVIMLAVDGYVKACPQTVKQRFYDSLLECVQGMKVQILDYFGEYYTDSSDYYHVTHFNAKGAKKFTERLIQDIEW